jgi:hypothetical protein
MVTDEIVEGAIISVEETRDLSTDLRRWVVAILSFSVLDMLTL